MTDKQRDDTACRRCGQCCMEGGPALHTEDLELLRNGTIDLRQVVTLRKGEMAYDQPAGGLIPLASEILKIRGRDGSWTCLFYSTEGASCGIYESRPAECRVLNCRQPEPLAAMYSQNRLTRADVLPAGSPFLELIADHDANCSPAEIERLARAAYEGDDQAGIALRELVIYDRELRRSIEERAGIDMEGLDFLLGRNASNILQNLGVTVYDANGTVRFGFPPKEDAQ